MKRWYHREARKELHKAVLWYEDEREGLGSELLTAVQETIERIAQNPRRFPIVYRDLRQAFVPRFPYLVFFRLQEGTPRDLRGFPHVSRAGSGNSVGISDPYCA